MRVVTVIRPESVLPHMRDENRTEGKMNKRNVGTVRPSIVYKDIVELTRRSCLCISSIHCFSSSDPP